MKTRILLIPLMAAALSGPVLGKDSGALASARSEYQASAAKDGEAARVRYVTKLAKLLEKHVAEFIKAGKRDSSGETEAIQAELRQHPAPAGSDGAAFTQLRVGTWQTTRNQYLFKKDGTWFFFPLEKDTNHGKWHIDGNQYFSSSVEEPGVTTRDTIILLDANYFVHSDKEAVFFESRVK
jgi:hypothetical protein